MPLPPFPGPTASLPEPDALPSPGVALWSTPEPVPLTVTEDGDELPAPLPLLEGPTTKFPASCPSGTAVEGSGTTCTALTTTSALMALLFVLEKFFRSGDTFRADAALAR